MGKKTKTACRRGDDPFLPEDFLIQILVWVPIKSLLRFKSVCKSWRALIQSSFFIDLHTTATTSSSSSKFGTFILEALQCSSVEHYSMVLVSEILMLSESGFDESESEYGDWYWGTDGRWHCVTELGDGGGGDWYWGTDGRLLWVTGGGGGGWYYWGTNEEEDYDDDDKSDDDQVFKVDDDDDDQLVLKLDNLGLPSCYMLCYRDFPTVIAGSCNGLICLHDSNLRVVYLWNPATRQYRRLPKSITIEKRGDYDQDLVAFGFDVKTKDYKVVLITCFTPRWRLDCLCRVQVYSLSTDSWGLLEGINSLHGRPMAGYHGLYLNGSCFFMANVFNPEMKLDRFIISFDFTKEIITTMQFPDHDQRQGLFLSCMGGEKMALFTTTLNTSSYTDLGGYDYDNDGYEDCDIWVLNEHGGCGGVVNKESWTKLHSFQIKNRGPDKQTLPRGISNNGKFALLETIGSGLYKKMQLYNLVTKEAKKDFLICQRVSTANVYKPSLVSIIGGNGAAAAPGDRVISGAT